MIGFLILWFSYCGATGIFYIMKKMIGLRGLLVMFPFVPAHYKAEIIGNCLYTFVSYEIINR